MEFLTEKEIDHLNQQHTCPDCMAGRFLTGRVYASIDVRCDNPSCNHEFWLAFSDGITGEVLYGGRIYHNRPELYGEPLKW